MRWIRLMSAITLVSATMAVMAPASADAFFRAGAELRWVPLSHGTMTESETDASFEPDRGLGSTGIGVRALFAMGPIGLGAKFNLTRHVFDNDQLDYNQFDANAQLRVGLPMTGFAGYVELGPAVSLDLAGLGYNAGAGLEFELVDLPLLDTHLGLGAQYVSLPIDVGPNTTYQHEDLRAIIFLGVDLALLN